MNALVCAQAVPELEGQVWLPEESGNTQAGAPAHHGGDDDHAHESSTGTQR